MSSLRACRRGCGQRGEVSTAGCGVLGKDAAELQVRVLRLERRIQVLLCIVRMLLGLTRVAGILDAVISIGRRG
jgi:hypothetical protein